MPTGDLGIEQEGVIASVPCHVDKTHQDAILQTGGHPAKTVRLDLIPPPGRGMAAMSCDEFGHLCIGDWPAPAVFNRLGHMPDRSASRSRRQQPSRSMTAPVTATDQQAVSSSSLGAILGATGTYKLTRAANGAGRSSEVNMARRTDANEPGWLAGTYGSEDWGVRVPPSAPKSKGPSQVRKGPSC